MAKKQQHLSLEEFDFDELSAKEDEEMYAVDMLHEMNGLVYSAIELTKIIVECERAQNISLDRRAVLDIFNESIKGVGKGIATMIQTTS